MQQRHIIAMGGGGFSEDPDNLRLDRYVLQQARTANPTVCFLPTASGDSDGYIVRFYSAFSKLPCRPRHLSLFRSPPSDLAAFIDECDVIYVGGGNTRYMLGVWREAQIDVMLRHAWEAGVVLCGLSAGAICWFESGHTDSGGALSAMPCLGFLSGRCSPHYDSEPGRRPSFRSLIQQGQMPAGCALDDGTALHFVGGDMAEAVTSRQNARAYHVHRGDGNTVEHPLRTRFL